MEIIQTIGIVAGVSLSVIALLKICFNSIKFIYANLKKVDEIHQMMLEYPQLKNKIENTESILNYQFNENGGGSIIDIVKMLRREYRTLSKLMRNNEKRLASIENKIQS